MGPRHCRLLPFRVADGPENMAADEVLLETAATGEASLRFYGWSGPTLSLGYFQSESVRRSCPELLSLPWVRRASGGSALVHHLEVTYALALPAGLPWQKRGESWLPRMHRLIASALATLGVGVRLCPDTEARKLGEVLCFLHHTPGDLLIAGAKVAGSAQRKQRGALLQHGGILLASSPFTPLLPGIRELTGVAVSAEAVCSAVADQFAQATEIPLPRMDWRPGELERLEELRARKYARAAWNSKR
jgi:lipoate-protein ligase A